MKTPRLISREEMMTLFSQRKGTRVGVFLLMETTPKVRKTDNPYAGAVTIEQVCEIRTGVDYETSVNRVRVKEGIEPAFVAQSTISTAPSAASSQPSSESSEASRMR